MCIIQAVPSLTGCTQLITTQHQSETEGAGDRYVQAVTLAWGNIHAVGFIHRSKGQV